MEVFSLIFVVIVLSVIWFILDRITERRSDRLFKERVAYVLDEIKKRNLKQDK